MRRRYFGAPPMTQTPTAPAADVELDTTAVVVTPPSSEEDDKGFSMWKAYKAASYVGRPLAMAAGYYRSKKLLTAVGVSFVWLPYLMYVGIDTLSKRK
jgi:hypothetical protein